MSNFTTKQASLFYCYAIDEKQTRKIDEFLLILENSGVAEIIKKAVKEQNFGRPGLDHLQLLFMALQWAHLLYENLKAAAKTTSDLCTS